MVLNKFQLHKKKNQSNTHQLPFANATICTLVDRFVFLIFTFCLNVNLIELHGISISLELV